MYDERANMIAIVTLHGHSVSNDQKKSRLNDAIMK